MRSYVPYGILRLTKSFRNVVHVFLKCYFIVLIDLFLTKRSAISSFTVSQLHQAVYALLHIQPAANSTIRGIEWSLRAARLFLRAQTVIKYVLRAASTLKNTDGEQQALHNFSRRNLDFSLLKRNVLHHESTMQSCWHR